MHATSNLQFVILISRAFIIIIAKQYAMRLITMAKLNKFGGRAANYITSAAIYVYQFFKHNRFLLSLP